MTERDKLVAALVGDDPERLRLYRTSATFHHGLHNIAQLAAWAVDGVAADAAATDAEMVERRRLLERAPITVPLEQAGPLHGWSRAEDPGSPGEQGSAPASRPRPDNAVCAVTGCCRMAVYEGSPPQPASRGGNAYCHTHAHQHGVDKLRPIAGRGPE